MVLMVGIPIPAGAGRSSFSIRRPRSRVRPCPIVQVKTTEQDGYEAIFFGGYSMGGNLVLKMAGEFGDAVPAEPE